MVQTYTGTGTVSQSYTYDAFGVETDVTTGDTNPFRYAGQYFDTETGTYYLRARYYNPTLGRFTQQDAWEYAKTAVPSTLNLYVYCANNPVLYIDPSGRSGIMDDGSYYITHPLDKKLLQLKQEYEIASAKRKQEIASEAQSIRESGDEGVDWSVSAEKPLEYYLIDTDITSDLNDIMKTAEEKHAWKRILKVHTVSNIARYINFAQMVKPGGEYDLKSKTEWQGRAHYIYNDEVIWYDDPGNMLYGYLGKAMGFADGILHVAGGVVQIYTGTSSWSYISSFFDDPRDQASIKKGIQRYKSTHSWFWR